MKTKIDNWNMSVQIFLRRYVYQRIYRQKHVEQKHKKKMQAKAQMFTIALSAFWHGIYPSYMLSFMHWFLVVQLSQQIYRIGKSRPEL
jgi:lysophospholipid acyltransferase